MARIKKDAVVSNATEDLKSKESNTTQVLEPEFYVVETRDQLDTSKVEGSIARVTTENKRYRLYQGIYQVL